MKFRKKNITLFITSLLTLIIIGATCYAAYYANTVRTVVYLYGEQITLDKDIVNLDGKIYVPLRDFFEKLGYTVNYNAVMNAVHINSKNDGRLVEPDFSPVDLDSSNEGILDNGQTYKYVAQKDFLDPTAGFDYNDYLAAYGYSRSNNNEFDMVPNAKTAVELARDYLYAAGNENKDSESVSYQVLFDKKNRVWVVTRIYSGLVQESSPSIVAISSRDGQILN